MQPALIPELFGIRDYGFKYACLQVPNFVGSLLFATFLAGNLYERQANEDGSCLESSCYNLTFWITSGACACSSLVLLYFIYRTKGAYERIREELRAREA